MRACGFAKPVSESGMKEFLYLMLYAAREVAKDIKQAYQQGLCLDAQQVFANRVREAVEPDERQGITEELVELTDEDERVDLGEGNNQSRRGSHGVPGPALRR